jgi:hypothetical protein
MVLAGRRQKDDFSGGAKAKARKLRYRYRASLETKASKSDFRVGMLNTGISDTGRVFGRLGTDTGKTPV